MPDEATRWHRRYVFSHLSRRDNMVAWFVIGLLMGVGLTKVVEAVERSSAKNSGAKVAVFPEPGGVDQGKIGEYLYFAEVIYNPYGSLGRDDPPPGLFHTPYLRIRLQYKVRDTDRLKGDLEKTEFGIEPKPIFVSAYGFSFTIGDAFRWEDVLRDTKAYLESYIKANP